VDATLRPRGSERERTQHISQEPQPVNQTASAQPFVYHPTQQAPVQGQHVTSWSYISSIRSAAKLVSNRRARWIIPLIAAIIVLSVSGIFLVIANQPPTIAVIGNSAVTVGKTLHVHGSGFLPNGSVVLKLEDGEVLSPNNGVAQTENNTAIGASSGNGLMLAAGQLIQQSQGTTNPAITVNGAGTFDTIITISNNWDLGQHSIHATEDLGARSATLQFTIVPTLASLNINPSALDFGKIEIGKSLSIGEG
jgi:hypothetical protein